MSVDTRLVGMREASQELELIAAAAFRHGNCLN